MKIETVIVLLLTAIAFGTLVWIEMKSRRNPSPTPVTDLSDQNLASGQPEASQPPPIRRSRRR